MGTAVIFGAVWLGMIVAAGARPRHLLVLSTLLLVAVPFFAMAVMGDYQRERLALFFNPNQDPLGGGFNILQAEIGIGSGGLLGNGLTEGSQTQLDFLQTATTDYIFSVLGEELGFVGAMVLFTLFIVLLFQGIRTASMSTDVFGRLMATGIVIMISGPSVHQRGSEHPAVACDRDTPSIHQPGWQLSPIVISGRRLASGSCECDNCGANRLTRSVPTRCMTPRAYGWVNSYFVLATANGHLDRAGAIALDG